MSPGERPRVLVIEDDEDLRAALLDVLRAATYEAEGVGDGGAGLARMREWRPDLVVLDLGLPVMDGWQVLAAKRVDPSVADIPVVVLSGNSSAAAAAVHAELYLLKPLAGASVVQAVGDTLHNVDLRRQPQRAAQSERMAALGTLAAGIAHEINNPLTYVILQLERVETLTRAALDDGVSAQVQRALHEALAGAERIKTIARDITMFARDEGGTVVSADVRRALSVALRLVRQEVERRATLVVREAEVAPVLAEEGRLVQVFVNLLVNAHQALPEPRRPDSEIRVSCGTDDDGWTCVEIADTGHGIPKHFIGRVFEPFFTTKRHGEGTGLGLSISHGIVAALGGQIVVTSDEGCGTSFKVRLPPAGLVPTRSTDEQAKKPAATTALRRVLVVDDDPSLLAAIGDALEGVEAVMVSSVGAALDLLRRDHRFDAILCDIHMPAATGLELAASIDRELPHLSRRIVFMTGGAVTDETARDVARAGRGLLAKPFSARRLRVALEQVASAKITSDS